MNCDWGMVIAIIGTNIGLGAIVVGFMLWAFSKLDSDIKSISSKIDSDLRAQTERTDRLYGMFVNLQESIDKKFYELLKERKDPKTNS